MKTIPLSLWIFVSILFGPLGYAGGSGAGNGGDLVSCPPSTGRPELQMLDLYELSLFEQITPDFGPPQLGPEEKVSKILDDLAKSSPLRAAQYREELNAFISRVTWTQDDLVDIPDSQHIALPTGCKIQQLAIQNRSASSIHYTIDEKLWRRLDNDNKAGLILHELVYGEAIETEHQNSTAARAMVRFILATKGGETESIWKKADELGLRKYLEFVFRNGDVALMAPGQYLYDSSADVACGYRAGNLPLVNHCLDNPAARYHLVWSRGFPYIEKVYPSFDDGVLPIYTRPLSEVGLTPDFLDYRGDDYALPAHSYQFSAEAGRFWCKGLHWIKFEHSFDLALKKNSSITCDLSDDPAEKSHVRFLGKWYEILPKPGFTFSMLESREEPSMTGWFAQDASFTLLSNAVSASGFSQEHLQYGLAWSLYPKAGQQFRAQGVSCPLQQAISYFVIKGKDYLELDGSRCEFSLGGQKLLLASPRLAKATGAIVSGELTEDKTLKFVYRDENGNVDWKGTDRISQGTRIKTSPLKGYFEKD